MEKCEESETPSARCTLRLQVSAEQGVEAETHPHGLHVLALTDEGGRMIWMSAARPGRTHDITAARRDHILVHLRAAGLGALAELGFLGLDDDAGAPVVAPGSRPLAPASSPPPRRTPTASSLPDVPSGSQA